MPALHRVPWRRRTGRGTSWHNPPGVNLFCYGAGSADGNLAVFLQLRRGAEYGYSVIVRCLGRGCKTHVWGSAGMPAATLVCGQAPIGRGGFGGITRVVAAVMGEIAGSGIMCQAARTLPHMRASACVRARAHTLAGAHRSRTCATASARTHTQSLPVQASGRGSCGSGGGGRAGW